jgi:hypothetical protein
MNKHMAAGTGAYAAGYLDDSFLDRVRAGYRLALGSVGMNTSSMWRLISQRQAPVHAALMAEGNDQLRRIFIDPSSVDLFYGVDNISRSILAKWDAASVSDVGASARADLFCLAQSLGIDAGKELRTFEPDVLLQELDGLLSQHVEFPNIFRGEIGLPTARGIASYRSIQALYQVARLRALLDRLENHSVVEIGPGMGRTAYYAYLSGIIDYTTIDLPMGIVAQACFLGATLGPDKISLPGDHRELATDRIKLMAAGSSAKDKLGAALNCDSMTEMPLSVARSYVRWIETHAELFFSINHDANQFTVKDIAASSLDHLIRRPYPMRSGYWEEIFFPRTSPLSAGQLLRQRFSIARHMTGFAIRHWPSQLRGRVSKVIRGSRVAS